MVIRDVVRDDRSAILNGNTEDLLKTGEFANLVGSTKRTLRWYDIQGILAPAIVDESGYRFYKPYQIIDFQVISLLRELNFSLDQIKEYLTNGSTLEQMFNSQKNILLQKVKLLEAMMGNINQFYADIGVDQNFVHGTVKTYMPITVYYISSQGTYADIPTKLKEFYNYFEKLPIKAQFMTIFNEAYFKPKSTQFKMAVLKTPGLKIKKEYQQQVQKMVLPTFKAATYSTNVSFKLHSLIWKLLYDFMMNNGLKPNRTLTFGDIEFYSEIDSLKSLVSEDLFIRTEFAFPITS